MSAAERLSEEAKGYLEGPTGSLPSDPLQLASLHGFNQGSPQDVWPAKEPQLPNLLDPASETLNKGERFSDS